MKVSRTCGRTSYSRAALALILFFSTALFFADHRASAENLTAKTWDGGGTTNNWSEAANWSGDTVPGAGDDVTFDATSTKNATIDVNINVGSIAIGSGYTGTVTQSNAAAIVVSGCSGRFCFEQRGGTFNGSTNTITLNSAGFGAFRILGGTFNGGSGDISCPNGPSFGADFALQGGTFKSTSGTLTVPGIFRFQNPGTTFLHNGGTVTLAAVQNQFFSADSDHPTINFNNLNINSDNGVNYDFGLRPIVEGTLSLNDGTIGQGNNGTVIEARGGFSVSPNFDGGIGRVEFGPASASRTITFVAGLTYPSIRLNDPNLTVSTSGTGTLVMPHQLNISQGTFDQGNVDMTINSLGVSGGPCLVMSGGTFNGSSKTITLISDGFGTVFMTGGTFNGGSGNITATGNLPQTTGDVVINGGTFKSTSGLLLVPSALRTQEPGTFVHNGGTVEMRGGGTVNLTASNIQGAPTQLFFNNLTINRDTGARAQLIGTNIFVSGTLNLTDGIVDDGGQFETVDVSGNVNFASTFDGLTFRVKLKFSGSGCQTVTLNGTQTFPGVWEINKTGCSVTAVGNFGVGSISVPNGSLVLGSSSHANLTGDMTVDANGRVTTGQQAVINIGAGLSNTGSIDLSGANSVINVSGNSSNNGSVDLSGSDTVINISGSSTNNGSIELSGLNDSISLGSLTINPGGQLIADAPETIILGGDMVNNGLINLHGFGSECLPFGGTYVTLQSSIAGTRRNWSGNGVFRMVHVNVFDMGGTAQIKAHNSVDSSNNGANWTFDSECRASALHTPFDFDGDSKTDVVMYRPSTNDWWLSRSTLGFAGTRLGGPSDKVTPADYDGDGLTDIALWHEAPQSNFIIFQSATNTVRAEDFGITGDDPKTVADWDGDGKADPSVYRPGNQATFFFLGSKNNPDRNITFVPWGTTGDRPARGDFDGDGKQDAAIFRPADGNWWVFRSSDLQSSVQHWGISTDKTLDGDFDGDGKTDLVVFRPSEANWYILLSSNGQTQIQTFGQSTDVLTPGDYDGDGKTDLSLWRPSNGQTWTLYSTSQSTSTITFGTSGDVPAASAFE